MYSNAVEASLLILAPHISSYITITNSKYFGYEVACNFHDHSPKVVWEGTMGLNPRTMGGNYTLVCLTIPYDRKGQQGLRAVSKKLAPSVILELWAFEVG